MQFNVSSLLQEHTGAIREHDIDDDVEMDGEAHHVTGRVRFDRTPAGVLVRAKLSGEANDICSRCLRPFDFRVEIAFEEEYVPTIDVITGAHVQPSEENEDAYRISERHMLDLSEPVRQYWGMALPMAAVCAEDCAGLCPVCGREIAGDDHECTREQVDARWEKLAQLKGQ